MFSSSSRARFMQLRLQLQTTKKNSMSMIEFIRKIKGFSNSLAAIEEPVSYQDQIMNLLAGLGADYNIVVTSISARDNQLFLEAIYSLLLTFEHRLEQQNSVDETGTMNANFTQNNKYAGGKNYSKNNQGYQKPSNHGTGQGGNSSYTYRAPYTGSEKVTIGNGKQIPISHVGTTSLVSDSSDRCSKKALARGRNENRLYKLPITSSQDSKNNSAFFLNKNLVSAFTISTDSSEVWHDRLGHVSLIVVQKALSDSSPSSLVVTATPESVLTPAIITLPSRSLVPATHHAPVLTQSIHHSVAIPSEHATSTSSDPSTTHPSSPAIQQPIQTIPSDTITATQRTVTRSQNGIVKKKQFFLATQQKEPTTVKQAMKDPDWVAAMQKELEALQRNNTWKLVDPSLDVNIIGCKWVFKLKYKAAGTLERHKARLVAKGYNQTQGLDFFDTCSPVVKPATIKIVLTLALTFGWKAKQLDVQNAFLNRALEENVFMSQPPGFSHQQYLGVAIQVITRRHDSNTT
ncbi:hypothetical protein UlMin_018332 [Ulmus minor]